MYQGPCAGAIAAEVWPTKLRNDSLYQMGYRVSVEILLTSLGPVTAVMASTILIVFQLRSARNLRLNILAHRCAELY